MNHIYIPIPNGLVSGVVGPIIVKPVKKSVISRRDAEPSSSWFYVGLGLSGGVYTDTSLGMHSDWYARSQIDLRFRPERHLLPPYCYLLQNLLPVPYSVRAKRIFKELEEKPFVVELDQRGSSTQYQPKSPGNNFLANRDFWVGTEQKEHLKSPSQSLLRRLHYVTNQINSSDFLRESLLPSQFNHSHKKLTVKMSVEYFLKII
ncbi:hypothetical protein FCM35_KLT13573 [Carex littledalei]|uniref:Uncharacterized protein n=1 Tax=Carex littledalei TaxID=544730 RepID=A0A833QIZ8_9POAL|nr:hypothetical protein FCM35_KLT13573 [Carex littledalei]